MGRLPCQRVGDPGELSRGPGRGGDRAPFRDRHRGPGLLAAGRGFGSHRRREVRLRFSCLPGKSEREQVEPVGEEPIQHPGVLAVGPSGTGGRNGQQSKVGSQASYQKRRGAYSGLDPAVVQSARQSGIPEAHLAELARLANRGQALSDLPGGRVTRVNVLGEPVEDEGALPLVEAEPDRPAPEGENEGMVAALQKLTMIVDHLTVKQSKKNSLEDILEEGATSLGSSESSLQTGASRKNAAVLKALRKALVDSPEEIFKAIHQAMLDDFGSRSGMPGEGSGAQPTYRGWLEHRSRIPNIQGTVRVAWIAAAALDCLCQGRVPEAKARLGLLIASLDQVAYDRGQWIIAAEVALESTSPPFASFAKHTLPDMNESQFSQLLDARWIDAFISRVRDQEDYLDKREKLSRRRSGVTRPSGGESAGSEAPTLIPKPKTEPQPKKGKGKGRGGTGSEDSGAAA